MHSRKESDIKWQEFGPVLRALMAQVRVAGRHHPHCVKQARAMYYAAKAVIEAILAARRRARLLPVEDT